MVEEYGICINSEPHLQFGISRGSLIKGRVYKLNIEPGYEEFNTWTVFGIQWDKSRFKVIKSTKLIEILYG